MEIMMAGRFARMILDGHKTQTRRVGARWQRVHVGDVLHVREAFCANYAFPSPDMPLGCAYRADYDQARLHGLVPEPRWTPAVHMPLSLCRCKIRVTAVREEQLNGISNADACAEGMMQVAFEDLSFFGSKQRILDVVHADVLNVSHQKLGQGAEFEHSANAWRSAGAAMRFCWLMQIMDAGPDTDLSQFCTVIEFVVIQ